MAANLVRVRKFAILYRKIVRRSLQFAQKFANFFRGYFLYKSGRFQKKIHKIFELKFDLGIFLAIFLLFVIFYLVSSQLFKKFDSTRSLTPEVRLDSSSQKVRLKPSLPRREFWSRRDGSHPEGNFKDLLNEFMDLLKTSKGFA